MKYADGLGFSRKDSCSYILCSQTVSIYLPRTIPTIKLRCAEKDDCTDAVYRYEKPEACSLLKCFARWDIEEKNRVEGKVGQDKVRQDKEREGKARQHGMANKYRAAVLPFR